MSKPNVFIIGAAKAGTSSLYGYLAQHPQIFMSRVKEPHFFCYQEKLLCLNGPGDERRMRLAVGDLHSYVGLFDGSERFHVRGEGSTSYLDSEWAATSIRDFEPAAKIVVVLRDPVDRAYASYMHLRRDGVEWHTDFGDGLREEEERIRNGWEHLWHYKTRQFTYEKLKRYFDTFEEASIRIYLYEEWKSDNLAVLEDLFEFLEVDAEFRPSVLIRANVGGVPKIEALHRLATTDGPVKRLARTLVPDHLRRPLRRQVVEFNLQRPKLSPAIRDQLKRVYREDVLRLQDLIKRDLSRWL